MQLEIRQNPLGLAKDALLGIRDGRGVKIHCLSGGLWVTQEGSAKDIILEAGGSHTITDGGLTLVTALVDAKVALTNAAPRREGGWIPANVSLAA